MSLAFFNRVALTLLLALAAAATCLALHTPLPWMIGPLLATAAVSMTGAPTESWTPLRNSGQWVIGAALGLYFTPEVTALVAGLWWAVVLGIAWALHPGWVMTEMGGEHATLPTADAVRGLLAVIDAARPAQSGSFLDWRGESLPW